MYTQPKIPHKRTRFEGDFGLKLITTTTTTTNKPSTTASTTTAGRNRDGLQGLDFQGII